MKALVPVGLLVGLFAAEIASGVGGQTAVLYTDDLGTVAAALAAFVLCLRATGRQRGRLRTFWGLLATASGSWALGELLWAVYDLGGGSVPDPSWADAAYLAAVLLTAAALLAHPAVQGRTAGKVRAILDGSVIAASLFFVAWLVLLGPLWRSADMSTLGGLVMFAYPCGDAMLLFLIVLVVRGTTNRDRVDLWLILLGLIAMTASDAVYAYLSEVARYSTGNIVDVGWVASYLVIAAAAYSASPQQAAESTPERPTLTRAALLTPFAPMLIALTLAAVDIHLTHHLDRVAWIAAVILVSAVLLRQLLLAADLYTGRHDGTGLARRVLGSLGGAP